MPGSRLNPFVFRAYYCADYPVLCKVSGVSIPLFSGRITAMPEWRLDRLRGVSIPLFSGRITAHCQGKIVDRGISLNPFVFRAYYCGVETLRELGDGESQSLCFQGVLLRLPG